MSNFKSILDELQSHFVENDEKYINGMIAWTLSRKEALTNFKARPDYRTMDTYKKYDMMFAMCGGKTWFKTINDYSVSALDGVIRKICEQTIKARNTKIAAKLDKAGIMEVVGEGTVVSNTDGTGFHGVFYVNTNAGRKTVKIETIIAGGYNIQCMHYRTLVNVK